MVLNVISILVFIVVLLLSFLVEGFGYAMSSNRQTGTLWDYIIPFVVAALTALVVYGAGTIVERMI